MTQPQYYTNCELRIFDLTNGEQDYLWVDYEDALHNDITGDAVSISLGTYHTPGAWHPADLVEQNGAVWQVRAGLFIGAAITYPVGVYYAWIKLVDSPAVLPKRAENRLVEIT